MFQRALTYQVRARARGVDEDAESGVFEEEGNAMDMSALVLSPQWKMIDRGGVPGQRFNIDIGTVYSG